MCRVYWRVIAKIVYSPLLAAILNFCVKCKYVFISEMEQARVILTKLLSHRDICRVYWRVFTEILLPPLLAAILNFFIKCKNVFILEMERARVILTKSLIHSASAVYLSLFTKILFPPLLAAILNFCIKCVYFRHRTSYSDFDEIFDPQGMCRVYWRVIAKIVYSPLLAAILNFCVKCKDVFISEMEQVRVILTKLLSHRDLCIVYSRVFTEILVPPLLAAILNFFIKCKNVFILEMERARAILTKSMIDYASPVYLSLFAKILFPPLLAAILNFCIKCVYFRHRTSYSDFDEIFDPQGMCRVYWRVIAKIVYSPLLAAILNFCVKCKEVFISEMEQVRVILTELLSHRDLCIVYYRVFTEILLPPLLAAILNFCIKCVYLGNEASQNFFDKIFDPQGTCIFDWCLLPKIVFPPLLAAILYFCIKHVYFGQRTS